MPVRLVTIRDGDGTTPTGDPDQVATPTRGDVVGDDRTRVVGFATPGATVGA